MLDGEPDEALVALGLRTIRDFAGGQALAEGRVFTARVRSLLDQSLGGPTSGDLPSLLDQVVERQRPKMSGRCRRTG